MASSLRADAKAHTRERIMQAAIDAFSELGYRSTAMSHIAHRAGVGRATLYLHFAGKAALADEIARSIEPLMIGIVRTLPDVPMGLDGMQNWVSSVLTGLRSFGPVTAVVNDAIGHNEDLARSFLESMRRISNEILTDLRSQGWDGLIEAGSLAMLLTATMQMGSTMLDTEDEQADARTRRDLASLWLIALTAGDPRATGVDADAAQAWRSRNT